MAILGAWVILASYIKMFSLVVVIIIVMAQFVLLRYYFGLNAEERRYDALIDGVPDGEWESESQTIFWTSIFTSWISPTTVWSNNIINKCTVEELKEKYDLSKPSVKKCCANLFFPIKHFVYNLCRRSQQNSERSGKNIFKEKSSIYKRKSKILLASGLVNNIVLLLSLLAIVLLVRSNTLTFPVNENPPIFHCINSHQDWTPGLNKNVSSQSPLKFSSVKSIFNQTFSSLLTHIFLFFLQ